MATDGFVGFSETLAKLSDAFQRDIASHRSQISEADVRLQFLDPFFAALGWDVGNRALAPFYGREVVVEPPYSMQGHNRRPDYLFKVSGIDKFVCEAKRPGEDLTKHYFQVQNYVYNLKIWVGVLTDFEHFRVFLVGSQPTKARPFPPLDGWQLHFSQYVNNARKIWDVFARDNVANGSLERLAQDAAKVYRPGKQGWLLKPERAARIDEKFLQFLQQQRSFLAKALHRRNRNLDGQKLTEATQKIINRLLFQRICEDRNIDVGRNLTVIVESWEAGKRQKGQLWPGIVANFKYMSKTFNGGLYGKPSEPSHFINELDVSEDWLADFLEQLAGEDSNYLLSVIPVEILGSVYERFLGSIVTDSGDIVLKPEARKSKGVYYTPKSIVNEIVDLTIGEAISEKSPKQLTSFRVLDPACGSGSFLLGAFESICRHHLEWLLKHPEDQNDKICFKAENDLRLTTGFKRKLLVNSIFGVDIDSQAVEVTQMSLYLKVLEDETTQSLNADHRLFPKETYLPTLDENIKVGNSLIDFSNLIDLADPGSPETEITAFNWQAEFPSIMKSGGFDTVIGNPPYFSIEKTWGKGDPRIDYLRVNYPNVYQDRSDILFYFLARAYELSKGSVCFIVSRAFLEANKAAKLRAWLSKQAAPNLIIDFRNRYVFDRVGITTAIVKLDKKGVFSSADFFRASTTGSDERAVAEQLLDRKVFDHIKVPHSEFSSKSWLFGNDSEASLIAKTDQGKALLGDIMTIGQGMQTGLNEVFGGLPMTVVGDWELPDGSWYVRARNSDIKRWTIHDSEEVLLYPTGFERLADLPEQMRHYLTKSRTKLKARAAFKRGNCKWWHYSWPLHAVHYVGPRLLCPYLAKENRFALDENERFLGLTDTTVLFPRNEEEDIKYFLGLLNSKILTWRFRFIGKLKSGGILEYFDNSVAKLPIHRIDFSNRAQKIMHDEIVKYVSRLMTLCDRNQSNQSASRLSTIIAIEGKIDQIVRQLYDLSDAEFEQICDDLIANEAQGKTDDDEEEP